MSKYDNLVKQLESANKDYRSGNPSMSDYAYDHLLENLPEDHWYRSVVEAEDLKEETFIHPIPMLSTQKAKTDKEINKWLDKVQAYYNGNINIKVTAKLDGMAARYYKTGQLVTRGNGNKGNVVTSAFRKGVINISDTYGVGELVMTKEYFEYHLKDDFAHPRNAVVGIVMSDNVNPKLQHALDSNAVHFADYQHIYSITTTMKQFREKYRTIENNIRDNTPYPIDGVVIEVVDKDIKRIMGSTDHHNNWQIALKPKDEEAITTVRHISWQTGRTGKVTPVLNVQATELDGSVVRRVTAHNARMLLDKGVDAGADIGIIRSGGVIPKLESVKKEVDFVVTPNTCPSCDGELVWSSTMTDLLCMSGSMCPAQVETKLIHFFHTIEAVDGFGPSTIEKIVGYGYESINDIYNLMEQDFVYMGFGEKTAANLTDELDRSTTTEIEDWRFLAAFGVHCLGKGNSKKLLKEFDIQDIFSLTEEDIMTVEGFGEISSRSIVSDFAEIEEEFFNLFNEFTLKRTILAVNETQIESPVSGKVIVFTGAMTSNRKEMQAGAEKLGAIIGSGVSSKTDILVTGAKVGQAKITKAESFGTKVITESEYYELLK